MFRQIIRAGKNEQGKSYAVAARKFSEVFLETVKPDLELAMLNKQKALEIAVKKIKELHQNSEYNDF